MGQINEHSDSDSDSDKSVPPSRQAYIVREEYVGRKHAAMPLSMQDNMLEQYVKNMQT